MHKGFGFLSFLFCFFVLFVDPYIDTQESVNSGHTFMKRLGV